MYTYIKLSLSLRGKKMLRVSAVTTVHQSTLQTVEISLFTLQFRTRFDHTDHHEENGLKPSVAICGRLIEYKCYNNY